jgi:hypothetical protein
VISDVRAVGDGAPDIPAICSCSLSARYRLVKSHNVEKKTCPCLHVPGLLRRVGADLAYGIHEINLPISDKMLGMIRFQS